MKKICAYCKKEIAEGEKFSIDPYDLESYVDTFIHEKCFREREMQT